MALALLDDKDIHLLPKTHAKLKLSLSKRVAQLHKKELENQRFNQYKDIAQSLIREFPIGQEENAYKKMRAEIHDKDDYQGVKQQFDIIRNEELLRRKNQKDAGTGRHFRPFRRCARCGADGSSKNSLFAGKKRFAQHGYQCAVSHGDH